MEEITIYWSPATFSIEQESWNLLYAEPESVLSKFNKESNKNSEMRMCPSIKNTLKNVFSINSTIDDYGTFDYVNLKDMQFMEDLNTLPLKTKVSVRKPRKTSLPGYTDLQYNLSWFFVADKPVTAKMTSPYFPATSPTPGAILAPGEFDIGKWFRPFNLDYHIPIDAKDFSVQEGDPLFFLDIQTDAKINFKRFDATNKLINLAEEMSQFSFRYGKFKKLQDKYRMAKNSKMMDAVLKEIRANLLD